MPKSASIVLAILLGAFAPAVQAQPIVSAPRVAVVALQPTMKPASEIRSELWQASYAESRSQTTNCANFAAIRALMAKASGSDFAIQNRVLNVTFLLCMHGASQNIE
jgi:hypothetical protein